ncbi:hypothetical protein F4824DRAFT_462852, partial [Ustulina deusta]
MISQQRDASSLDAIVTYMLEWTQTLNEINSQYADTKQSDEACFQEELGLLLEKQNSLRNELQRIEKRLQHVRSNYNTVVKDREQADATRVEAHVKTLSEYDFTSQISIQAGQQVEQARHTRIAESQAPESALRRSGRNTRSKPPSETIILKTDKSCNAYKRPRLHRRMKSTFTGSRH